jgi:hypothetical protein
MIFDASIDDCPSGHPVSSSTYWRPIFRENFFAIPLGVRTRRTILVATNLPVSAV